MRAWAVDPWVPRWLWRAAMAVGLEWLLGDELPPAEMDLPRGHRW